MLSKHVAFCLVQIYNRVMKKNNRTSRVVLTPEAMVLRQLRERQGLTMRAAGLALKYSDSYISQIENGRENVPTGERLAKFLKLYGDITEKYFKQLCKQWKEKSTERDTLCTLINKLPDEKVRILLTLAQQMANKEI